MPASPGHCWKSGNRCCLTAAIVSMEFQSWRHQEGIKWGSSCILCWAAPSQTRKRPFWMTTGKRKQRAFCELTFRLGTASSPSTSHTEDSIHLVFTQDFSNIFRHLSKVRVGGAVTEQAPATLICKHFNQPSPKWYTDSLKWDISAYGIIRTLALLVLTFRQIVTCNLKSSGFSTDFIKLK